MQVWLTVVAFLVVIVGGDIKASESTESVAEQLAKTTLSESTSASSASIPFKDQLYQRFVSLGYRCFVTYNINYYLGVRTNNPSLSKGPVPLNDDLAKRKPHFWGAFPFDWVRIEDYRALIRFIHRNFTYFFEQKELEGFWEENKQQVLFDRMNGISRRHLLESFVLKEGTKEFIQPAWDEEYARCRDKVAHVIDKFRALKQYKTLYIINASLSDNYLVALKNALTKNRGNENFTILQCHHEIESRSIGENIVLRKTDRLDWDTRWYWDLSVLDEFKLDPKILEGLKESYKSDKAQ